MRRERQGPNPPVTVFLLLEVITSRITAIQLRVPPINISLRLTVADAVAHDCRDQLGLVGRAVVSQRAGWWMSRRRSQRRTPREPGIWLRRAVRFQYLEDTYHPLVPNREKSLPSR